MRRLSQARVVAKAIGVCCLCVGFASALGYWAGNDTTTVVTPPTPDWPQAPPDEAARAYALSGVSFACPDGWRYLAEGNELYVFAPSDHPLRSEFRIVTDVDPILHPRPLPGTIDFQGLPAYMKIRHIKTRPDEAPRHRAHVVFYRAGRMFEITFSSAQKFSGEIPEVILQYIESFRIEESRGLAALSPPQYQ